MKERIRGIWILLPIVVLGIIASLVLDLDIIKSSIGTPWLLLTLKAVTLALAAGSGVFSYIRSEQRHKESATAQEHREALAQLEGTLFSCIQNLFVGEQVSTIRANVMTVCNDELCMRASANMRVYSDYKVRLKKGQGCAGLAWERAVECSMADCWQPIYVPKAQLTTTLLKKKWKLTDEQIRLTSHILWILSIPLFRKSASQHTFIGVLNFDGVNRPLRRSGRFRQQDFKRSCLAAGDRIADITSALDAIEALSIDNQRSRRVPSNRRVRGRQEADHARGE